MINPTILRDVSRILTENKITWAIGGSYLLYIHGLYESPNDIDIWVSENDFKKLRIIFSGYEEIKEKIHLPEEFHFKIFYEKCAVDFVAYFSVNPNQKEYDYFVNPSRIQIKQFNGDLNLPCLYLEEWYIIYDLLNKEEKLKIIENYLLDSPEIINEKIFDQCLSTNSLPERIKNDVVFLLDRKKETTFPALGASSISDRNMTKPKLLEMRNKKRRSDQQYEQISLFSTGEYINRTYDYYPPLRLVINSDCNGHCNFCHHEGNKKHNSMSKDTIKSCAKAASKIGIPIISITGGEPTLRKDLHVILGIVQKYAPQVKIHLTTNGKGLLELVPLVPLPIDTLNLSMSSFRPSIYKKYQDVDPKTAIEGLLSFPAQNKNLNVVITQDNYLEIESIVNFCVEKGLSLTLMFELKKYNEEDLLIQRRIFDYIETISSEPKIVMKFPPIIELTVSNNTKLSIKHPGLNVLPEVGLCKKCESDCLERLCAIRVLPDGTVTACLNQTITSKKRSTFDKIENIYSIINTEYSLFSFLTNNKEMGNQ